MRESVSVTGVRFLPAHLELRQRGVLGFAGCVVDDWLELDSLTVKRVESGEVRVLFPTREDASGRRHAFYRPISSEARDEIEQQVIGYLRERGYVS